MDGMGHGANGNGNCSPQLYHRAARATPTPTFVPNIIWLERLRRLRRVASVAIASIALTSLPPSRAVFASVPKTRRIQPPATVLFDRSYTGRHYNLWDTLGVSGATPPLAKPSSPGASLLSPSKSLALKKSSRVTPVLIEDEIRVLMRLVVATTVGGIIGVERRIAKSFAGVRTFSLVSLGSAIFMSTCLLAFPYADPARIAAAVSSSVGFIGGGVMSKNSRHSRGLTTASSVWLAAGLGVAAASGLFLLAYAGALLTVLITRYARFDNSLHLIRGDPLYDDDESVFYDDSYMKPERQKATMDDDMDRNIRMEIEAPVVPDNLRTDPDVNESDSKRGTSSTTVPTTLEEENSASMPFKGNGSHDER